LFLIGLEQKQPAPNITRNQQDHDLGISHGKNNVLDINFIPICDILIISTDPLRRQSLIPMHLFCLHTLFGVPLTISGNVWFTVIVTYLFVIVIAISLSP
jgi:hypothetical protein